MRSFQYVLVTVFFSLTWRTIDAVTNDEAKGDGNELKTVLSSVSSNKQMGTKQANLFGNRKLHGLFSRMFRLNLVMCDCDCDSDTSSAPSAMNSTAPSVVQSSAPSAVKSSAPSKSSKPSLKPSSKPSLTPSGKPSSEPSTAPSQNPSSKPSLKPSSKPSLVPSHKPSSEPSTAPSQKPSSKPSLKPSSEPSLVPSNKPSLAPSEKPSTNPSLKPSLLPTLGPLKFTKMRLSTDYFNGACICLRWNDDGTVTTESCEASSNDRYEWDYDAEIGHLMPTSKTNECLERTDNNEPILATCSDDTMTDFKISGPPSKIVWGLAQDGDQYFSYNMFGPDWSFMGPDVKNAYFLVGCTCDKCPV